MDSGDTNSITRHWIITEADMGWFVTDAHYGGPRRWYKAAALALKAIRQSDTRRAGRCRNAVVVSRIEWNLKTALGRRVVAALQ